MTEHNKSESSMSLMNAADDNTYKQNYQFLVKEDVKGTPFTIVGAGEDKDNKDWMILMGNVLISPISKNKEEVIGWITDKNWNLIINLAGLMAEGIIRKILAEENTGMPKDAVDNLQKMMNDQRQFSESK